MGVYGEDEAERFALIESVVTYADDTQAPCVFAFGPDGEIIDNEEARRAALN